MLPNFLILGAQKSGTSWLHAMLSQHPEVFLPEEELHFFDKADRHALGVAWYESHFAGAERFRAVGEKTPDYLWANGRGVEGHLPDVHHNVQRLLPDAKLIITLRDPVERAVSAALHLLRTRRVSPLHSIDDLLVGDAAELVRGHGVIEYGYYHRQITAYLELFRVEQMCFLIFEEDIRRDPDVTLRRVCEFLEIDLGFSFAQVETGVNVAQRSRLGLVLDYYVPTLGRATRAIDRFLPAHRPRPSPETQHRLYELYRDENERLFELLGRRPASWLREVRS